MGNGLKVASFFEFWAPRKAVVPKTEATRGAVKVPLPNVITRVHAALPRVRVDTSRTEAVGSRVDGAGGGAASNASATARLVRLF
jgi:hypothetical protein